MRKRLIAVILCGILVMTMFPCFSVAEDYGQVLKSNGTTVAAAKAVQPKSITITGSKYVAKGKKITLKAAVSPAKASQKVTWSSSNKKIATVNSKGVVKGIKAGNVTITAKSKANPKVKKTWKLTVKEKAVKSISISGIQEMNMTDRKEIKLKAKAKPASAAQSFEWKSSDIRIATVSSKGVVKAVSPGTVKITVTAIDGSKVKKRSVLLLRKGRNPQRHVY